MAIMIVVRGGVVGLYACIPARMEARSFFKRKIKGFLTKNAAGKDSGGKYDVCEYGVM